LDFDAVKERENKKITTKAIDQKVRGKKRINGSDTDGARKPIGNNKKKEMILMGNTFVKHGTMIDRV
jgi:hypothetical protein